MGDVRLVNGTASSGRLEWSLGGEWVDACVPTNLTAHVASAACQFLGLGSLGIPVNRDVFGSAAEMPLLAQLECEGEEEGAGFWLPDCNISSLDASCFGSALGVICSNAAPGECQHG